MLLSTKQSKRRYPESKPTQFTHKARSLSEEELFRDLTKQGIKAGIQAVLQLRNTKMVSHAVPKWSASKCLSGFFLVLHPFAGWPGWSAPISKSTVLPPGPRGSLVPCMFHLAYLGNSSHCERDISGRSDKCINSFQLFLFVEKKSSLIKLLLLLHYDAVRKIVSPINLFDYFPPVTQKEFIYMSAKRQ